MAMQIFMRQDNVWTCTLLGTTQLQTIHLRQRESTTFKTDLVRELWLGHRLEPSKGKCLWGDLSSTVPVTNCLVAEGTVDSIRHWMMLDEHMGPNDPSSEGICAGDKAQ